jgi:molybdopterin synthase sulfur carrier subunit
MTSIRLDAMLREFVPSRKVEMAAPNVAALLDGLEDRYPRLRFKIRDESGAVRQFVRVFVNGEEIHQLDGLKTRLGRSDTVDILHSIQGG